MFVDEQSKEKAIFTNNGPAITFSGNYDKKADAYGLWTAGGVASTQCKYQMLICDTTFYKGLHFSGFATKCVVAGVTTFLLHTFVHLQSHAQII